MKNFFIILGLILCFMPPSYAKKDPQFFWKITVIKDDAEISFSRENLLKKLKLEVEHEKIGIKCKIDFKDGQTHLAKPPFGHFEQVDITCFHNGVSVSPGSMDCSWRPQMDEDIEQHNNRNLIFKKDKSYFAISSVCMIKP